MSIKNWCDCVLIALGGYTAGYGLLVESAWLLVIGPLIAILSAVSLHVDLRGKLGAA